MKQVLEWNDRKAEFWIVRVGGSERALELMTDLYCFALSPVMFTYVAAQAS